MSLLSPFSFFFYGYFYTCEKNLNCVHKLILNLLKKPALGEKKHD